MAPVISGYTPRINAMESNEAVGFGRWLTARNVQATTPSHDMDNNDRRNFANLVKKANEVAEQRKKVELRPPIRIDISGIVDIQA